MATRAPADENLVWRCGTGDRLERVGLSGLDVCARFNQVPVRLSKAERAMLMVSAKRAHEVTKHIPNPRKMKESQLENRFYGVIGEYTIARPFGLSLEACSEYQMGVIPGWRDRDIDLTLPCGDTVQVRACGMWADTSCRRFGLLAKVNEQIVADWGVLVLITPDLRYAKISGFISRDEWAQRGNTKLWRHPTELDWRWRVGEEEGGLGDAIDWPPLAEVIRERGSR